MNEIALSVNEEKRNKILDESVTVFKLNCDLIRSVDSANYTVKRLLRIFGYTSVALVSVILAYWYFGGEDETEKG